MLQIVCQISCVHINMSLSLCDDSHHHNLSYLSFVLEEFVIMLLIYVYEDKKKIYYLFKLTLESFKFVTTNYL